MTLKDFQCGGDRIHSGYLFTHQKTLMRAIISRESTCFYQTHTPAHLEIQQKNEKHVAYFSSALFLHRKRHFFPKSRQACQELRLKKSLSVSLPSSKDFH